MAKTAPKYQADGERKNLKKLQKSTLDSNDLVGPTNYCQLSLRPKTSMKYMNYMTAQ